MESTSSPDEIWRRGAPTLIPVLPANVGGALTNPYYMITAIPNVDPARFPVLNAIIDKYMTRYEYRLDGSSLWEGRVRPVYPGCLEPQAGEPEACTIVNARLAKHPSLVVPPQCKPLPTRYPGIIDGWRHDKERLLLVLRATDFFAIQHVDADSYAWELKRSKQILKEDIYHRDLMCGYDYAMDYLDRLLQA